MVIKGGKMKKLIILFCVLFIANQAQPTAWKPNQKDISPIVVWGDTVRILEFDVVKLDFDYNLLKINVSAIRDDSVVVRTEVMDFSIVNRELGTLKVADSSFISIVDGAFIKIKQKYNFIIDP